MSEPRAATVKRKATPAGARHVEHTDKHLPFRSIETQMTAEDRVAAALQKQPEIRVYVNCMPNQDTDGAN